VVVISSAIKPGNPELDEAPRGLPIVRRAEMLRARLNHHRRRGTHRQDDNDHDGCGVVGWWKLEPDGCEWRDHSRLWIERAWVMARMVVEADESDGTSTAFPQQSYQPQTSIPPHGTLGHRGKTCTPDFFK
jgi:UDP-N-acetylmuramate--alanine ligase